MKYRSTRGNGEAVNAAAAIIRGLASDGGLFVPTEIPHIDAGFIESLVSVDYLSRAKKVLSLFLDDYTDGEIASCVEKAYGNHKFDTDEIAPIKSVADVTVLELWHGPTSAFKDMALQLLPQTMSVALGKTKKSHEVLILVATSGDTGKAALAGFADADQIKIMVFYPDGGVSQMQRLQMVTQQGKNVSVVAVRGNFDDAQSGVKKIFGDAEFNEKLGKENFRLSSANSINWGRLVPQIVYYFSAYADMISSGRIKNGDEINFTVPTGNFGNILAGFYAKMMGLPVGRFVCASNENNVLTDFIKSGKYDKNRKFYKTISPSMDILISSNLERLLYHISNDGEKVRGWMESLAKNGCYDCGENIKNKVAEYFWADYADDVKTSETIKEVFDSTGYVLDPHTAVAWHAAHAYMSSTNDARPMVVVSTASPYKFSASVLEALNERVDDDPFAALAALEARNSVPAPKGLASLRGARILHEDICDKDEMENKVFSFVKR